MDTRKEQTQQELFEEFAEREKSRGKLKGRTFPQKKFSLTLSSEALLFSFIALIAIMLVSFSLGVERGKSLSARRGTAEVTEGVARSTDEGIEEATTASRESQAVDTEAQPEEMHVKAGEERPYAVQLVTYRRISLAKEEVKRLKRAGFDSFSTKSGKYHLVLAGPYSSKDEAKAIMKKLKSRYSDCFVKKVK